MASFPSRHPYLFAVVLWPVLIIAGILGTALLFKGVFSPGSDTIFASQGPSIAVVAIKGVMVDAEKTITALTECRKNEDIKAVILRIDSPGGVVGAAQEIFTEVRRTDAKKPVIASLGAVAASGGYYAAIGARKIIASPGTVTGSIGVILRLADLSSLYDKIGYQSQVVASGALKDTGNTARPLSQKEREMLDNVISNMHDQFIHAVVKRRGLEMGRARTLADGRVYTGEQALREKLVDALGNFTDAVQDAAKMGGIDELFPRIVRERERKFSLAKFFTAGTETAAAFFSARTPAFSYLLQLI